MVFWAFFCGLLMMASPFFADYESLIQDMKLTVKKQPKLTSQADLFIRSDSFVVDLNKNEVFGKQNVDLNYHSLMVDAKTLRYSLETNNIYLNDEVKMKREGMTLHCDTARAQLPEEIEGIGDVRFDYNDYFSSSDKAVYSVQSKHITFLGDVSLQQGEDFVRGNRVVFDIENEKVLSQGRAKIKLSTERFRNQDAR